jgi:anti-anti-sigma factor
MSPPRMFAAEQDGSVLVLRPHKNVSSLADLDLFNETKELCRQLHASEIDRVIVDFSEVEYFGSLMLESLRILWNEVHAHGGRMALCNVSPVGREILGIARFDTLWPVCASRSEAMTAVQA